MLRVRRGVREDQLSGISAGAEREDEAKESGRQAPTGLSYTPSNSRIINEQAWEERG